MPPSCAETAELLDADSFTVKSIHELKYRPLWSWLPSDHLWYHQMAISRLWGRIRGCHAQKGWRGMWVHLSLVWGRRVESAVEAGRRNRFQAMCCSKLPGWLKRADEPKVAWLIEKGGRAQSCLVDWKGLTSPKLLGWLKRADEPKVIGLVIFSSSLLQLWVDEK
jgi:hypothetical protein